MKILLLVSDLRQIGGIQIYNKNLIEALEDQGVEVEKIEYRGRGWLRKIFFVIKAFRIAIFKRHTLLWCGHVNFSIVGFWMYKLFGIKYFVSVYGIDVWNLTQRQKKFLSCARKIISISNFTADKIVEQTTIIKNKIDILPPCLPSRSDFEILDKPKYLKDLYGGDKKRIILTIARLSSQEKYKGYDKIIDIMPEIVKKEPEAIYIIVGEGDDLPRISKKIIDLGMEKHVYTVGMVSNKELPDYYNLCDVFILPSSKEGFGIVLIEALYSGKPVIAESAAGAIEALDYGKLGKLVDFSNLANVTEEIIYALRRDVSMGERQTLRDDVSQRFGYKIFNNKISAILENYLASVVVCYFGRYPSAYPRARVFIDGLAKNGIDVIECQSNHKNRFIRLIHLIKKYIEIYRNIDIVLVCEAGQAYTPLAKILSLITRKPIALDAFLSYFHVKTAEGSIDPKSFKGRYYYYLDKIACKLASLIFLDTPEHIEYFSKTFHINKNKFVAIPVGSNDEIFYPRKITKRKDNLFRIFNVSSFYPLHGVEYIVKAAKLLEKYPDIVFNIYGTGQNFLSVKKLAEDIGIKNLYFYGRIDIEKLPDIMSESDICLGQFGGTQHSDMVISTKVFDALAMAKPVITADGPSIRSVFKDGENIFLCEPHNPDALAKAILDLKNDKTLMEKLGVNGRKFFLSNASSKQIGLTIKNSLYRLLKHQK